jgi:AcrR family transcriptional regulator
MLLVNDRSVTRGRVGEKDSMTKADIIQAAFRAWGRGFYRNTSLTTVAKELKVSKPALYRHFCCKQALLDAMYESFFDDYAAFVKDGYERAAQITDHKEAMFTAIRVIMEYYARNVYAFIFSLVRVYGEQGLGATRDHLVKRGVNTEAFARAEGKLKAVPPQIIQAIAASLSFSMARFHKLGLPSEAGQGPTAVDEVIFTTGCIISNGLGFQKQEVEPLDFEALEQQVSGAVVEVEEDKLLHAVAEAVAGAGPWDVSMEMVARRSGLSKSGLYAHFKNKQDMLAQLFLTEIDRIIGFAEESMKASTKTAERLYLAIFSICDYLRSRPDILIALDWLRTRNIMPDKPEQIPPPPRLYRIFRDIHFSPEPGKPPLDVGEDWVPSWILFLIVNTLMYCVRDDSEDTGGWNKSRRPSRAEFAKIANGHFRTLYQFITRGIREFAL